MVFATTWSSGRRTPDTLRLARIGLAVAGLAAALIGPARAGEFPQAERYFALRDRSSVVVAHPDKIAHQPAAFRGRLIEIRGVVSGQARRDDGATFIVATPDGRTYLVEAGASAGNGIELGHSVRVLARTGSASPSSAPDDEAPAAGAGSLTLVAVVSEYEAAQQEVIRAREAARARAGSSRTRSRRELARRSRFARRQLASRSLSVLQLYRDAVLYFNRRLSPDQAERIARSILAYSHAHGLDARLVMAVIAVESRFNAGAVSSKGAMGLGQLMPGTAQDLGVRNPWNPEENIGGATRLLRGHLDRMSKPTNGVVGEEQLKLALACYNAGLGAVKRHGGVPPYRETKNYVVKVTRLYRQMCGLEP